ERVLSGGACVESLELHAAMPVPERGGCVMQTIVEPGADNEAAVRIFSRAVGADGKGTWTLHASGRCTSAASAASPPPADLARIEARCPRKVDGEQFYRDLESRRLDFGPALRGLRKAAVGDGEALAEVELPSELANE